MTRDSIRQLANIFALGATITMNALANILPINGQTTGDISNRIPALFVPANYVFGIWGLIYAGLIAFALYQALPSQKENPRLRAVGWWFVASCVANSLWIVAWHYEQFELSVVLIVALLLSLLMIYRQVGIGQVAVSRGEWWFVHAPFSLYTGWATVATIAGIASTLVVRGWDGFGIAPDIWTVVMLVVASLVGIFVAVRTGDRVFVGVLVWAFIGIALKQAAYPLVATTAWVAAVAMVAALVMGPRFAPAPRSPQRVAVT